MFQDAAVSSLSAASVSSSLTTAARSCPRPNSTVAATRLAMARARYWLGEVIRTTSPERACTASKSPPSVSARTSASVNRNRSRLSILSATW